MEHVLEHVLEQEWYFCEKNYTYSYVDPFAVKKILNFPK